MTMRANSTRVMAGDPFACATPPTPPPPRGAEENDGHPEDGPRKMPPQQQPQQQQQQQQRQEEEEEERQPKPPKFVVGDVVHVESRTWPGINKPGGVGKIMRCNMDGSFTISYVLGGSEKRVQPQYIHSSASILFQAQRPVKERDFFANYKQRSSRRKTDEDGASVASADSSSTLRTVLTRKGSVSPKRVRVISSASAAAEPGVPAGPSRRPSSPAPQPQKAASPASRPSTPLNPSTPPPASTTTPRASTGPSFCVSTPPPSSSVKSSSSQYHKQAHATPPRATGPADSQAPQADPGVAAQGQQSRKTVAVPSRDPPKRKLETSTPAAPGSSSAAPPVEKKSSKKKSSVGTTTSSASASAPKKKALQQGSRPPKQARTTESLQQIRNARHEHPQTVEKVVEKVVRSGVDHEPLTRDTSVLGADRAHLGTRRARLAPSRTAPSSLVAQMQLQNMERMDLARKFEIEHSQTHKVLLDALSQQRSRDEVTSRTRLESLCLRVNKFWRPMTPAGALDPRIRKRLYLHTSSNFRRLRNKMLERQAMEASILRSKQIRELVGLGYDVTKEHIDKFDMCPLVRVDYKYRSDC